MGDRSRVKFFFVVLPLALVLSSCLLGGGNGGGTPLVDGDYVPVKPVAPAGWPAIQWPGSNPYSPAKDILGRRLFFEPRLSRTLDRACSWCHGPAAAFADVRHPDFSVGVGQGVTTRNTPSLANMAFAHSFMLEGRAASLEEQALGPLFAANEMDMTEAEIVARLSADTQYVRLFRQAYGPGPVTLDGVTKALATYQRTLISSRSRYDRWIAGDTAALSVGARRGEALFFSTRTGCASCHVPPLFTDGGFHNIGLDTVYADAGRGGVTGLARDAGKFKTPTLRNVEWSGPYMHDGRFNQLAEVVRHYNAGGAAHPNADARVRPLGLTDAEVEELVAFLETLTDTLFLQLPEFRPSE